MSEMSSAELVPLFSTPVFKSTCYCAVSEDVIRSQTYEAYPDGTGYSSQNTKVLLSKPFKDLRNEIEEHLKVYVFDTLKVGQGKIVHTQSWINLHRPGNYSPKHFHSNSCYSGIVYLKVPPNGGGIIFSKLHTAMNIIAPTHSEMNIFNSDRWGFDVEDGDIFLFPSHLIHSTDINHSEDDRFCLAFNYFLEGTLGQNTGQVTIRIKS